jgi:hypothetical protein
VKEQLEAMRLEAIRQLEQERQDRDRERRQLEQSMAALDLEGREAPHRLSRAKKPLADHACPRCWIWDGKMFDLKSVGRNGDVERFLCSNPDCPQIVDVPLRHSPLERSLIA